MQGQRALPRLLLGGLVMKIVHTIVCLLTDVGDQEEALPMWITRPKTRESNESVRLDESTDT